MLEWRDLKLFLWKNYDNAFESPFALDMGWKSLKVLYSAICTILKNSLISSSLQNS